MSKRMDVAFAGIGIPGNSILADQIDRAFAIASAIRGKIINSLVVDSECAGQLLKLDAAPGK